MTRIREVEADGSIRQRWKIRPHTGLIKNRFRVGAMKLTEHLRGNTVVAQRDGFERNFAGDRTHQVVKAKWRGGFG